MRPNRTRLARRALLALLVVVSGAVAWSLRRPPSRPGPEEAAAPPPGQGTTVADGSLLRFREGRQKIAVKWQSMVGREGDAMQLRGVEVTVPFVARGRESTATITADECSYEPSVQRAAFRGNVRLKTAEGLELESETLKYWGDEQRAFTRDDVRFRRNASTGSGRGLEYRPGSGLALYENVRLQLQQEGQEPTDVEASSLVVSDDSRILTFDGGVRVQQGRRELRSRKLQLNLDAELSAVERAAAVEDVDLRTGGGLPGSPGASSGGEKRLRCRRLNVVFRAQGVLHEAIAVNGASLEVPPGPGDPPERRTIAAPQLDFKFDEEGRLVRVEGRPGRQSDPAASPRASVTGEPMPPQPGGPRRVESERFEATLDPASGALRAARFRGSVTFSEPGRRAWAGEAEYEESKATTRLSGDARIVDERDGSELRGRRIVVHSRTRNVEATGDVRHTVGRGGRGGRPGVLGGAEDAVLLCQDFAYDSASRTARYRDNAVLRSGRDEIRAPELVIEESGEGRRRLTGSGGTTSTLFPRPARGEEKAPAKDPVPVESRSRGMVYEEAQGTIVYTGDVEIRQGDILTLSPEAVVTLTRDGGAVERLVAGTPVEVRQGARRATGDRGTYTPANEKLVLVGDRVVLQDADRRLEGRVLTFEVGSDRIRVDGRDEVRTEAVFKRKEPPSP